MNLAYIRVSTAEQNEARQVEAMKQYQIDKWYTKDLLDIVEHLTAKGVFLISNKENIDTSTPTGKLMLTMIAAINEFERTNLLERQREGIAIAKAEGKYKGRKPVAVAGFEKQYQRYQQREISKSGLARELGISRPTLDKLIAEYQTSQE